MKHNRVLLGLVPLRTNPKRDLRRPPLYRNRHELGREKVLPGIHARTIPARQDGLWRCARYSQLGGVRGCLQHHRFLAGGRQTNLSSIAGATEHDHTPRGGRNVSLGSRDNPLLPDLQHVVPQLRGRHALDMHATNLRGGRKP